MADPSPDLGEWLSHLDGSFEVVDLGRGLRREIFRLADSGAKTYAQRITYYGPWELVDEEGKDA